MPIRNEGAFIAQSLRAVLEQDYPSEAMEVIVVDGMSTDNTRDIVLSFQKEHSNLKMIDNPGRIAPTGLNAGIAEARGEIIVRVDGHCVIESDHVRRSVEHLLNDGVDGVGGPIETIGETRWAEAIATAMSSRFGVGDSAFRTISNRSMLVDTIAFPAYTRAIIERAGPYDEELVRNQDDEYNYRLRKIGARLLLSNDIHVEYFSRSSIQSLWRQYFQYGYWKVRVMQKHPRQMRPRQFIPPLFAGSLFITLVSLPFSTLGTWLFCLIACLYGVANIAVSVAITVKKNWRLLFLLPPSFATIHLSYGFGFLVGLLKFWNRWGKVAGTTKGQRVLI